MKTVKKTYVLANEEHKCILKETLNEKGRVVHSIDLRVHPPAEYRFEYDENDRLIKEIEYSGDVEMTSHTYEYDENGTVILQEMWISETPYEKTVLVKNDNGSTRTTYQDGEESERHEEVIEQDRTVVRHYEYGDLIKHKEIRKDLEANGIKVEHFTPEGELSFIVRSFSDEDGSSFTEEELDAEGKLLYSKTSMLLDGVVVEEKSINHVNPSENMETTFEYDANGNNTKLEQKLATGHVLTLGHRKYDDKNRMIEEFGFTNAHSQHLNKHHFWYEYEELEG